MKRLIVYLLLFMPVLAIAEPVGSVETVALHSFKVSLWIFGGICALIVSLCFFARR